MRDPCTKAQRRRQKPSWPEGQPDEFLGRPAAVQQLSTYEHDLEGARIAPSETRGAGVAQRTLDRRTQPSVGFCPFAIPTPPWPKRRRSARRNQDRERFDLADVRICRMGCRLFPRSVSWEMSHLCATPTRSTDPMQFFTSTKTNGRVRREGATAWTVEITESPDDNISIGTASEVGKTQNDASIWSLRVRGGEVPGLFVVEDGRFVSIEPTPA
jgi:hypothetical protein